MNVETKQELKEKVEKLTDKNEELNRYKLIYKNLRYYFDLVVDSVLGKDYYNMGMDTYTCDKLTCEDLIRQKRIVVLKDKTNIQRKDLLDIISDLNFKSIEQDTIRIDEVIRKLEKLVEREDN